jgi:cell division protein FtsB
MALSRALPRHALRGTLVAVSLYYAVLGGEYSAFDLLRLGQMQEREQAALEVARVEVDSLRARATLLESDPATIERVARERFGMVRDGELLYRFVPVVPAAVREARVAVSP